MKNIITRKNRWSGMALLMLLLSSLLLMPSCEKEEVNNDPLLQSFGPSPALRGGELRFIGQNLGEVTAVIFPGVTGGTVQVTDIITVNEREIKVMIPQDAGVGILTLVTTSGEIKTLTPLTFSEPISISKVSPLKVKAGETLTIEGDYLNLIKRVIFVDNVAVEAGAFLPGQTRKKLQVTVPAEAQSGKIIISNGEEIPIEVYSESDLEVVLPSVAAPADLTGKKPGEVIEIAGSDFDLVVSLLMPNGDEVPFEVIETEAGEAIRFTLPANMTDGVVIVLPASGVEVAIANIGLALPANVVATPATGLRAGDLITLEGLNMELVTSLTFPGVAEAVEPESKTATEVTVTMPDAATSGNLLLNTGSGVSVEVAIETLKPTFTAYENRTVPLGDNVVITGEDLDLVVRVLFTGGAEVEVNNTTPTSLTVAMPTMNVESGVLTLFMANGESVEIESLTIEAPLFAFIPILPGEEEEIKAGGLFGIEVTNLDKLTTVKVNDAEVKFIVAGNMMYITIPQIAANATKLTLVSSNGSIDYTLNVMPMGQIENVVYHGPLNLDWGTYTIAPDAFVDFTNGTVTLKITYAVTGDGDAQIKFYNGHWEQMLQRFNDGNDTYLFDPNSNVVEFELTQEELVMLQTLTDWGQSMIFHGQGVVINNIVAVYKQALETTVWSGDVDLAAFTLNYEVKPPSIFLDADVKAGMTLRIYVDSYGPEPKLQFFNGHWERIYGDISIDATNSAVWSDNVISLPIDAAIAANLREYIDWGYCLIVQGQDCILKKITIE
ncbi:MAG: hypothetical protein GX976_06880 [Bacteroidales bacterium]|nr:hypothetical protein [Bacteroidales bacterium]